MQHRFLIPALLAISLACSASFTWACQVSCEVTYAGSTHHLAICPTQDPDQTAAVTIGDRFRFKAIHVNHDKLSPRVGIYVYLETPSSPLLLQHVVLLPPYPLPPAGDTIDLLGEQHLYAGPLERELIYRCAMRQETP
jgi:hypothetical protein